MVSAVVITVHSFDPVGLLACCKVQSMLVHFC